MLSEYMLEKCSGSVAKDSGNAKELDESMSNKVHGDLLYVAEEARRADEPTRETEGFWTTWDKWSGGRESLKKIKWIRLFDDEELGESVEETMANMVSKLERREEGKSKLFENLRSQMCNAIIQ